MSVPHSPSAGQPIERRGGSGTFRSRRVATTKAGRIFRSYLLILPALIFLGLFIVWPFLQGVQKAFYNYNGGNVDVFVGLQNFKTLFFTDPLFWPSVRNVFILTAAWMFFYTVIPLIVSWIVHHFRSDRTKYAYRILVILPVVVPGVVISLLWKQFLASDGALNQVLRGIGLGSLSHNWLADPSWVLVGLILVGLPWLSGVNSLLLLAAFGNIPSDLYEAAALDGSGRIRTFFRIELPFVAAQTRIILVLSLVGGLQSYEGVYILTNGGPADASVVPGILLFRNAFSYGQLGYASAIGLAVAVFVLGVLIASTLIGKAWSRRELKN